MRSVKAPFPMTVDYAFADEDTGTRVTIRVTGEPGGLYRLAGSKLASKTRDSIGEDLERLRALLESP
jgi:carbon monoxide dehydrogenase subunit G